MMRRHLLILTPYLWLVTLFLIPFLIVVRISLSDAAIAIPPYSPILDWRDGWPGLFAFINALDFDVPQRRKRAFLVAVPEGQSFAFPVPKMPIFAMTAGDAIAGLPEAVPPHLEPLAHNHVDGTPERDRYRIRLCRKGCGCPRQRMRHLMWCGD